MPKLEWDKTSEKTYELGSKNMALYVLGANGVYETGVAWNGITSVSFNNTGGDENALWADDMKYGSIRSVEECGGSIEAFTCPREFYPCDGKVEIAPGVSIGQQNRTPFGFAVKTTIGNDTAGLEYGYKLHIVYNATASPSERSYSTINDSPDAQSLSWDYTCTSIPVANHKPIAHLEIDSTEADATKLAALETILFGGNGENDNPRLPLPAEIATLMT